MKLLVIFWRMLRYRVAVMLLFFFYFGVVLQGGEEVFVLKYLYAAIALLGSYVAATTLNDIADQKIDRINHPGNKGRPLVTGEVSVPELFRLHLLSAGIAIWSSFLIGPAAFLITIISLSIDYIYSWPPIRLSYRTHFAPIILTLAYVLLPYSLGVVTFGGKLSPNDFKLLAALMALFFGRILLKDFRDRKGDSKFGKPTFLLVYGKEKTCLISFVSVLTGNALLFLALSIQDLALAGLLELYFLAVYFLGYTLFRTGDSQVEQWAIGLGARMGNGALLSGLGLLILRNSHASAPSQYLFMITLAVIYLGSFFYFLSRPKGILRDYKG